MPWPKVPTVVNALTFMAVSSPPLPQNPLPAVAAPWTGRSVLITGGFGFIGSTLARRLCDQGAVVTVLDCLLPQFGGNRFNLQGYEDRIRCHVVDLREGAALESLLEGQEVVFNLAGQTSDTWIRFEIRKRIWRSTSRLSCACWSAAARWCPECAWCTPARVSCMDARNNCPWMNSIRSILWT